MATTHSAGRTRDALICQLASEGPVWATFLVLIGLFKSPRKATARLTKLWRDKKLKRDEVMLRDKGHPTYVYVNGYEPGNKLVHDVFVRWICGLYWKLQPTMIDTGPERADARAEFGKSVYFWEFDRNTEGEPKLKARLETLRGANGVVLFVAEREERCNRIYSLAKEMKVPVYVARFADVVADPYGKVYAAQDGTFRGIGP